MHGYALVKAYRERSGVEVSTGNFYRELQRLVLDGLIRSADNPPEADARRTPYEITQLGVSVFDEWLTAQRRGRRRPRPRTTSPRAPLFVADSEAATVRAGARSPAGELWFVRQEPGARAPPALAESEGPDAAATFRGAAAAARPPAQARRRRHRVPWRAARHLPGATWTARRRRWWRTASSEPARAAARRGAAAAVSERHARPGCQRRLRTPHRRPRPRPPSTAAMRRSAMTEPARRASSNGSASTTRRAARGAGAVRDVSLAVAARRVPVDHGRRAAAARARCSI